MRVILVFKWDGGMRQSKPPWLAVIVCVIAVIVPGLIVGAAASFVFRIFAGPAPDPFGLHMLFGIDAVSKVLSWCLYVGMSAAVHGAIAGAVAVGLTRVICRGANIATATLVTGVLYGGLVASVFLLSLFTRGITEDAVASVFQVVGLEIGLVSVAATAPQFEAGT
jgi:hypothetical protein